MTTPEISPEAIKLLEEIYRAPCHPELVIFDSKSEYGKYVLDNRDGEMDFDGFHHAYVKRDDQTFLVPLWEWEER